MNTREKQNNPELTGLEPAQNEKNYVTPQENLSQTLTSQR